MNRVARFVAILGLLIYGVFASQGVSQAQSSNKWSSLGQMTQARSGAAAVLLTDGRVLITGGSDNSGIPQATAELYDPETGAFTALPAMNVPRANHAAVVLISGDVLVTGGLTTGGGYSDSAEIFNPSSQKWTAVPNSMSTGLAGQTMVLLSDGNVLIAGGIGTANVVNSIVLFNTASQTFTPISSLLTARTNAVAAATPDGRVLIAGGTDINGAVLASTEIFTYSTSTMTGTIAAGPTMSSARDYATATTTYDGVAIIGGNDGNNDQGTAELFSQWTNTIKVVSGGTPRSHHFAVLLPKNGSILAMGGTGGSKVDLLEPWANSAAGAFLAAPDSLDNQDGGFGAPAGLGSLLAAGGTGDAASTAELYSFPTVSTQNLEYAPGTTVDMSGTGFQPNETVDLHIHEWVNQTTEDLPDATVTANVLGDFSYDGYSPNKGDVGARYHLTAVGESSGSQAQTIFGDSINSIDFSNPPLNQATNACGALTLTVGGSAPYGTIYLSDSTAGTGTFYSNSSCTTAITSIAGAATVTIYYSDTTAATPTVTACTSTSAFLCGLGLFGTVAANQTETIYGPKLAWTVLPSGAAPGAPFTQQPVVEVLSAGGTVLTTSSAPVTLTLTCSGGFGGCTGALTCNSNPLNATAGVAAFSGCSVSAASANQYCLVATSPGIAPTGATDACFYVTAVSTANSSVTASPGNVPADGASISTITVQVSDTLGNPVVGKTITLTQGTGASVITTVSASTDGNGDAIFTVTDKTVQNVTYTATDSTDNITIGTVVVGFTSNTTTLLLAPPTPNPTTNGATETLSATLTDTATGAAIVGATVNFTMTGVTGTACSATTIAGGVATCTATVPATGTTFTVGASFASTTIGGVTYAAATGSPSQIITVGGTASTITFTSGQPPASEVYNVTFRVNATSTSGGTINYSVAGACTLAGTNVTMTSGTGSCYVTASVAARTVGATHYNAATKTVTVTATKATQATLRVTGAPASAADGSTFSVGYSGGSGTGAVTFAAGTGSSCTISGTQVTMTASTGSCSITVTQAADVDYSSATSAAVVVNAASGSGSVVVTCSTFTYNGSQPVNPCSATTTPTGLTVNLTYNGSSTVPTNAGSYTVVGTISSPSYTGTGSGTLLISPEPVTAIAGSVNNTYTGSNNIPVSACTVSGTYTGPLTCTDNPALVGSTVGSGTVVPVMNYGTDVAGNYTVTSNNGSWTIGQASSSVSLVCPASIVYSGAAQTPCTATVTVTGASGVTGLTATTQYVNNTNVGIASAVATFPGNADVTSSASLLETFQITALPATITLGNLTESYTGNQAAVTVTTTPPSLAYTISYTGIAPTVYAQSSTPPVNPGSYTVVATITDPNYSGTTTQTLTIGPITPPMILSLNPGDPAPPFLYGSAVSFDLDVNNGAAPAPCPTGTVQFYVNGTASGTPQTLPATCNSSLFYQIATLPLGTDTIYGIYSGDANYPQTQSNTLTESVTADATGVNLASTATSINVGGAVTFTATVTPSPAIDSGASGPGGTVQFYSCAGTVPACDATNGTPTPLGAAQTLSNTSPYTVQLVNPALAAGTYTIGATYTSSNGDFSGSSGTLSLTVTVGLNVPNINWNTPSSIVYGTALTEASTPTAGTQLDATATDPNTNATVPGGFVYNPVAGTVLDVGQTTLNVAFTPTDGKTYSTAGASVTLDVLPATLTVTADNQTMSFGGTVPTLTYTITGCVNGDSCGPTNPVWTGTAACSTTATATSPVGGYPITCKLGGLTASNYNFTFVPGILQVTAGTSLTIATLPSASNITFGQTLASSVLTGGTATFNGTNVPGTFAWTTPTTAPPGGTNSYSVTFTANSSGNYNTPTAMVSVTVLKADPTIATLPTAAAISVGQALSASGFTGGTATFNGNPVPGTFTWTTPTLIPAVGTDSESVTFTPTDTTDYNTATTNVSVVVNNKTTPTVTVWPTAAAITYGQTLVSSALTPVTAAVPGNASVAGTFAWSTPTTAPGAGTPSESVTFTPTDTTDYNTVAGTVTVTVNKATPTIATSPAASAISLGQALSGSTLTGGTATNPNGGASVLGTFAWTTPGTVPPVGTATYSVTFTPTDTTDYNTATLTVSLTVNNKTTPTVTVWPTASAIIYGQTLAASVLTPVTAAVPGNASVAGTFAWTTPTTAPGAGTPSESVTFTPTDTTDYNTVTSTVTVTVSKATPTVSTLPTATAISVGQTLSASTLNGGTVTFNSNPVLGTFTWTTPTLTPAVGTDSESVTFTPTDTTDYNTVTTNVSVVVNNKTTPTVTVWPTASAITYGQTLASSALTPVTAAVPGNASVAGTFAWSTPTTAPGAGTPSESVTFTPTDTTNYNTVTSTVSVTVNKATPAIGTPPTAGAISLGQALSGSVLTGGTATNPNGGASVLGTFAWTTPGTVPPAGTASYSVTFTPTDTTDYNTATLTVSVTVNNKTTPTVTVWPTASTIIYGQTLASSVLTPVTAAVPGNASVAGTFTWTAPTTAPGAGTPSESVTFTPTDTTDYNTVTNTVSVTVNKATPTIGTPPTAGAISVGQALSASVLTGGAATNPNGGASVLGTFTWTTPTTVPPAGTNSYSVTFTPTDTTDYTTTTINVSVTANNKTTPTVTVWPTASAITYGQTLASSTLTPVTAAVPGNASVAGTFSWTTPATAPGAGTPLESVTFTPTDTTNYNTVTSTVSVTVNKATPAIGTPPTAGAISVGQALSASVLTGGTATNPNGGASVLGTFTWTTPGTVPPAGTASYGVTFTPTDTTDYNTATLTVSVTVGNKTTPTVTVWPTASTIIYGQTLASSVLTPVTAAVPGNASVAGTFTWTAPTTVPGAGTPSESVTFTPTDTTDYNTVTSTVTVTVSKATPTVSTLPTAGAIAAGQTLGLSTLTGGTATLNGNPVLGTFAWTTPATVPPLGTDPESVTFTPTDTTDYNTVIVTVSVVVNNKATPTVTVWPTAGAITYGQTLASSALTGGTASVAGSFNWSTPTTAPGAGTPLESVTFTPTDTTNYNTVTSTVSVTVNKATPTIGTPPTAGAISVGQALSASVLTGGAATNPNGGASVLGTFSWTTPTTVPPAGTASYSVTFTPTDTTDYNTATLTVSVTVGNKTTPTVTVWPTASTIYYGQTLASSLLTGGTASVGGTFTWTTPTTVPGAGSPSESVTFTPNDATDYNTVAGTVTVTVNKVTPTVTAWPTAAAIAVGQTLASSTLTGGTASVPGTFSWTTQSTVPGVGTSLESVTFTPTDSTDYNTAAGTVTLTVNKGTPTVTAWPTPGAIGAGQTLASSLLIGGTASVPGTFSWTTPTIVPPLGTDSESVTFTPNDTTDYFTVTGSVTVTVNNKTTPTVTAWPTAGAITSGQTLASSLLTGGAASVAGSFTWTVPATVPASGTDLESVTFTPADTNDYNPVIGNVTIAVNNKSSSSGTGWPTASAIVYGQTLASSTLTGGTPLVAGTFYWTTPATVPGAGNPSESVTFTPSDPTDHNTATGFVAVPVNQAPLTIAAVNASRVYGADNPAFTGGITGEVNGDVLSESYSTVAITSSSVGTYPIVPSVTGTNMADYAVTVQAGMLTITQAGTTTTLSISSSNVTPGQSVTLTAQVASVTTGTPTGTVDFYQGTTLLGTASLTAGTATFNTSSITTAAAGSLEAIYSGDPNFTTSTSATLSISLPSLDFSVAVSGPSSLTVSAGSTATYQMAVSPLYGSYPGTVSFTASGLPSGATATFNPTTIAANGGKQTVTLDIQTAAFAKLETPSLGRKAAPLALALLLIPFFGVGRLRRQGRRLSKLASLLLLLICTLAGVMMTGCGGGGAAFQQVAQNYTITVTATSGNVQHTVPITLSLQ